MNKFKSSSVGSVSVKIGVTAEPSDEFRDVAYALGFVRVVPCFDCAYQGTHDCPDKDSAECMAFCSRGRKRDDDQR
ncbi:hypothetical protein [Parafannyhessea umbonata]|uniref:Uncharacterized protein n=1 Tax=Parafannyhessea umbonata TaxID=604330 RepID=A0A1H1L3Y0_9ACTN|nr:hypothetical protein [Parafannyhessea umbonata]SDR69097.1 hypothetical protein SAMN04489857_0669 [Parafannyhessea umbonata]